MQRSLTVLPRRCVGVSAAQQGQRFLVRGGAPPPPPAFYRNKVPEKTLPESYELVWNDGVAPEPFVDFDAPHISRKTALKHTLFAVAGLATLLTSLYLMDPSKRNPAAPRTHSIIFDGLKTELGLEKAVTEGAAEDEEEEEE